jgi:FMN phosphatase YigB (HAD superfamily)
MRDIRAKDGSRFANATESPASNAANHVLQLTPQSSIRGGRTAAVAFVPGGVLYDDTLWRRWLLATLCRLGWQLDYSQFCRTLDDAFLAKAYAGLCSFDQAIGSFLRSIGLSRGQIDEIVTASRSRREYFESTLRPLPGAIAVLDLLSAADVPLAILADSTLSGCELQSKVATLGLGKYFDVVVSSCDLRTTLPHATNYQALCLGLELPPQQITLVGSRARDLAGASAFGLRTIACNYDRDVRADQYATALRQVAELIDSNIAHRGEAPRDRAAA